jgi:hypothetical protein
MDLETIRAKAHGPAPQLGSPVQPDDEMAGGGKVPIWPDAASPLATPVTSMAPRSVAPKPVALDPVPLPVVESVSGSTPPATDDVPPATADTTAGGGTTIEGLMPGLPLSTDVSGSAPLTNAAAAFGSGGAVESAGLPGITGLQMVDKDTVPNAGVAPAGVEGTIPLAASNAAVAGALVGDVAMPGAKQAVIAPSGPICEGAAKLPRLRRMPPNVKLTVPGRGTAVGIPG